MAITDSDNGFLFWQREHFISGCLQTKIRYRSSNKMGSLMSVIIAEVHKNT